MSHMIHFFCFLILNLLVGDFVVQVGSLNFNYSTFPKSVIPNFTYTEHSQIVENALQITTDANGANMSNLSGRVCFKEKLKLWRWENNTKDVASFNTKFTMNIKAMTQPGGEGLAFILTQDSSVPNNSEGHWLGIVNSTTNGSSPIVAIEFDTRKSYMEDIDSNHLGLNVNSINSIVQYPLSSYGVENISSGSDVVVNIQYDGKKKKVDIFVFMSNNKTYNPSIRLPISIPIDLSSSLPEDVYVGFSASTSSFIELNCVKSWSFVSTDMESGSSTKNGSSTNNGSSMNNGSSKENGKVWLWITIAIVILFLLSGFIGYLYWKKRQAENINSRPDPYIVDRISSTTSHHNFSLKELKSATNDFSSTNKLGKGGFGTVYKGFLKDINTEVAIKRVSKDSRQGKREFIAEVTTISHLEHKNLVKLLGWCYESNELLLVYKLMPNGSLDKFIFPNECKDKITPNIGLILSWEKRHNIICGVASALEYLHDGCEERVLHRDVKASNVMLDSEFNARLGDFGLARTLQNNGKTHHSTKEIAGTPGYMAPECFHTGRASIETDVYGFGIFVLEVVCGRRPGKNIQNDYYIESTIVEWVWGLYGKERIGEVIDPRLEDKFDKDQMERVLKLGLGCCHPNPTERPSMRVALQVLSGETDPPLLPNEKPAFVWPVMSFSHEDSTISFGGGRLSQSTDISGR